MKPNESSNPVIHGYRKVKIQKTILIILVVIGLGLVLGISACQPGGDATPESQEAADSPGETSNETDQAAAVQPGAASDVQPEDVPDEVEQPEEASSSDPEVIHTIWGGSAHADTFILDEAGNNNTCARCHAPVVWLPSMDDMPESCFACKFEVSDPPPLIPESDWVTIECIVCHEVDKKGNVNPQYAWLEIAQIEEYAEVATPSELCQKCHSESEIPGHAVPQLGGAHAGYECTDCHDAHDVAASCTAGGCHEDALDPAAPIPGHDQDHEQVTCAACHDAGDMQVDIDEQLGLWVTFADDPTGGESLISMVSHNTVLDAPCDRCHFVDNPWDLTSDLE